jgi:hypothetical protein
MRPVARSDAETADPMNVEAALRAVEREVLELAFEIGLHLQELKPQHLRVDGDRMIASTSSLRLVNELVGLRRLLRDGVDGVLEDVTLAAGHGRMLDLGSVSPEAHEKGSWQAAQESAPRRLAVPQRGQRRRPGALETITAVRNHATRTPATIVNIVTIGGIQAVTSG